MGVCVLQSWAMGRPPLETSRNLVLQLRVTGEEVASLDMIRGSRTRSDYIRDTLFGRRDNGTHKTPPEQADVSRETKRHLHHMQATGPVYYVKGQPQQTSTCECGHTATK